jgi:ankyrin repeat protein
MQTGLADVNMVTYNDIAQTPLHIAVNEGNAMLTRILIQDFKADPDCVDYRNNTPLHYAVINANLKIVKILLSRGNPRIDIENFEGQTVLKLPMKQDIKNVINTH